MRWKYFIPHLWDSPRQVWEDIYLLPDDDHYEGQAIWLTVDALGDKSEEDQGMDREEFREEVLEKLGNRPYFIDGADMFIRSVDFSLDELLEWVRVWMGDNRLSVTALVEGTLDEFKGKAFHADVMGRTRDK